jgi:lysozyme
MAPNLSALLARLKESEGWRSHVYVDTTGNLTIGWGHALARLVLPSGVSFRDVKLVPINGITMTIGEALLVGDVLDAVAALRKELPWFDKLDETRQQVLADMSFNLGVPGLMRWPIFLGQVRRGEYAAAARNMRATLWARQVGQRAEKLAKMMETGGER